MKLIAGLVVALVIVGIAGLVLFEGHFSSSKVDPGPEPVSEVTPRHRQSLNPLHRYPVPTRAENASIRRLTLSACSRKTTQSPAYGEVGSVPIVFSNSGCGCQALNDHPCRAHCSFRGRGDPSA
jgi:hypothetical protein